ncbi:MAG TPA: peptidase S1 [Ruminiclostridium sp.]|nr:peptidase S1 [Ruminiclostridium sp.]
MDEFNNGNSNNFNKDDNSWNYTPNLSSDKNNYSSSDSYEPSGESKSYGENANSGYGQENSFGSTDRHENLKSSSFYNESWKKPSGGRLKGLLVPLIVVALVSSILTVAVGAYFTVGLPQNYGNSSSGNNISGQNTPVKQIEIVDNTTSVEAAVAEKVSPSIVGIRTTFRISDMFFGTRENQASGSGIIYRSDGYIITNNHVIEDAMGNGNNIAMGAKIEVILPNQVDHPYEATIVGRDSQTDLAILKINASELPAAEFADSDKVIVGEKAIAIGNPAGLEFMGSVTSGIISGLNRTITFDDGNTMKLIQTDAAINPGNSGGALLNSTGQVIGINTSKIGGSGYEGLGFAIPSNNAKDIAENLIQSGYVKGRPQLGISVDTRFNADIAKKNKVPEGVLVYDVQPLSGAYNAGIRANDILTKFNGAAIKSFNELETEKNKCKAGDKVEITLYRMPESGSLDKGETITVEVTLGEDAG